MSNYELEGKILYAWLVNCLTNKSIKVKQELR